MKKSIIRSLIAFFAVSASAAEPSGYYSSCQNLYGASLLSKLESVISNHTNVGYDGLWTLYGKSDVYPNGKIWDMYSTKQWTYRSEQCGSYKNVGDCYNREHSMPKSWFNDASPMYSDAFHIYPTDGRVNGQRADYPYGECAGGTTLAGSGNVKALGRLGKSTFSGYSGTVFEPDDEYKGDFARSYFYMAAAYNSKIKNWDTSDTNLGGTSYPAFNSWSVELLMKWHRQDPVSDKELARNEAVWAEQRNRNPFIDHPELAEHIWGDKKTTGWTGAVADPELSLPVNNSTVNFGSTMTGISRTATVTVKGANLTGTVTVSVSGTGFSASTTSFQASAANSTGGYTVTVTFLPASTGSYTGTLRVACGSLSRTVNLKGSAVNNIPAGPVTGISDDSFEAVWVYVGDDDNGSYTLSVTEADGRPVAGYPRRVTARDERYVVEGLDASTKYSYTIASKSHTSDAVTVTTLDPIPSVTVLFDGDLVFETVAGEPSEAAELLLEIENISSDISFEVGAPFQLSSDKSAWNTRLTISPEEDRIYLRLLSENAGRFNGTLIITAGSYTNDNVDFTGTVTAEAGFHEDFEADAAGFASYSGGIYQGTAAKWKLTNAGIYNSSTDRGYDSLQAVRFGKDATSSLEMTENTPASVGVVTLWAHKWSGDADAAFSLDYSADGGSTWTSAGTATASTTDYRQFTFTVNSVQPVRLRVRQTSGSRWLVDEIEATRYKSGLVPDAVADYHRWDAFCRGGELVVEASEDVDARIFALDGSEVFAGRLGAGLTAFPLAKGLYIVSVDDFARRVLVK